MNMRNESKAAIGTGDKSSVSLLDGLVGKNTVLVSGLVIAPVVAAANTASNALILAIAFSAITFVTIMSASFISRNLVYTIRIILYTIIAALVYMPTVIMVRQYFPTATDAVGVFLPLLVTNSLIVMKAETRFFKRQKATMLIDVLMYILGFDAVILLFGVLRELVGYGSVWGQEIPVQIRISALSQPFGGFILLGLLAALFRVILKKAAGSGNQGNQ